MRIHQVAISGYKNVTAQIAWSRAVVLFGPNDAGKSNILEAIARLTERGITRVDPFTLDDVESPVSFVIEFDELDDDESFDASLLARLLQTRHVPPLFPYAYPDEVPPLPEREEELWGNELFLSQYPGSLLQWDVRWHDDVRHSHEFKIGTVGELHTPSDPVRAVGSLAESRSALRRRALSYAEDEMARVQSESYDPRSDLILLLDACLLSKWFVCFDEAGIAWLAPPIAECDATLKEAAARLVRAFAEDRIPIVEEFARSLDTDVETLQPFLTIFDTHAFRPWQVVWVSGSPERLDDLARAIEDFVRSRLGGIRRDGNSRDPWLDEDDDGRVSVCDNVRSICASLGDHATTLAPPFVTRDYEIRVEPLAPSDWHVFQNRRVRLALSVDRSDETFALGVAGSGLAIWAAFAIEEAMRLVDDELDAEWGEIRLVISPGADPPSELASRVEPPVGEQSRLYVLDEPERHLHPKAQEQAARWLGSRVDDRTTVLLATHALPFLSLPAAEVEYALVSRGSDRVTRVSSMTADVWGALDKRASESGLGSRAQLIQLARAFLIVEGAHDEAVVRHFFGHELDRHRIVVLPARGAKKARSLIEAELLALLDAPMIVLFDGIRADSVVADAAPSKKDVAAYALWEMLQHWPAGRKQPHLVCFDLPDIFCALPDACVARTVTEWGGSFPGWDTIVEAFDTDGGGLGFKQFFLNQSGLGQKTDSTKLLHATLDSCRIASRQQLKTAIAEVIERATVAEGYVESTY